MTDRKGLMGLARLIAKDVAAGELGENAWLVTQALDQQPEAALEIIELILAENRKKRPNQAVISALAFIFGYALRNIRYGIEAGHAAAQTLADRVRDALTALGQGQTADSALLLLLLGEFAEAKLDPGEHLRSLMADLMETSARERTGEVGIEAAVSFIADLVEAAQGDPFTLHGHLLEMGNAFPEDHRAAMAAMLLHSGEPVAREAVLGWLFDPSPKVREAVAQAIDAGASQGLVTGTMLRRMIAMRNWLPEASRPSLDGAIQASRRKGVECAPWPAGEVRDVIASAVDGAGAQGVFVVAREGRRYGVVSLLVKQGVGVRDAWVQHGMTRAEVGAFLAQTAGEMDQFAVGPEILQPLSAHFLAMNLDAGVMPPFAILDVLETTGLSSLQPEAFPAERLLDMMATSGDSSLPQPAPLPPAERDRLLAQSRDTPEIYSFLDSWFEDSDEVARLLGSRRMARAKRIALIEEYMTSARRGWWADILAWTAFTLHHSEEEERWQEFHLSARALLDGVAIDDIPIMRHVAALTEDVHRSRPSGR